MLLLMLCRLYGLLCGLLRRFMACWHYVSIGAFYSLVAACTGFAGALQVLCVFGMASSAAALPGFVSRCVAASPGGILGRVCCESCLMIGALFVAVWPSVCRSPAFSPVPCLFVRATFKSCCGAFWRSVSLQAGRVNSYSMSF